MVDGHKKGKIQCLRPRFDLLYCLTFCVGLDKLISSSVPCLENGDNSISELLCGWSMRMKDTGRSNATILGTV